MSIQYLSEDELKNEIIKLQKVERLRQLIQNNDEKDNPEIGKLISEGIDVNYKKTLFGEMCMLMIKKILTMPKFSGYTYKDDFTSNAIEKLMSYTIKNFDPDKQSKITKENVRAFAYCTQIIMNAILQVINERKKEQDTLKQYFVENTENIDKEVETKTEINYDEDTNINVIKHLYFVNDKWFISENINEKSEYITKHNLNTNNYYTMINDELRIFVTVFETLNYYKSLEQIKFIYPKHYLISIDELNNIQQLNLPVLNIVKFQEKYIPKFPKKQSVKYNSFDDWLQEL